MMTEPGHPNRRLAGGAWLSAALVFLVAGYGAGSGPASGSGPTADAGPGTSPVGAQSSPAFWISVRPGLEDSRAFYLDLSRDGTCLYVVRRGDMIDVSSTRLGTLPPNVVAEAFEIVSSPPVLEAVDTDPGEPMFSRSSWVNVTMATPDHPKDARLWRSREQFDDYPAAFRKLLDDLAARGKSLPSADRIIGLLAAGPIDTRRARGIREDPRRLIQFVELADIDAMPTLARAIGSRGRLFAISDEQEVGLLSGYIRQSNPGHDTAITAYIAVDGQHYSAALFAKPPRPE